MVNRSIKREKKESDLGLSIKMNSCNALEETIKTQRHMSEDGEGDMHFC
jgi:hypothetical protein